MVSHHLSGVLSDFFFLAFNSDSDTVTWKLSLKETTGWHRSEGLQFGGALAESLHIPHKLPK